MKQIMMSTLLFLATYTMAQPVSLDVETVASGFTSPVGLTHAGDGSNRLFVIETAGQIKVVENGVHLTNPFLNFSGLVTSGGEQGFLGLAFHPDYASNGYFYVYYSDLNGDMAVVRYQVSSDDANVADPNSAQTVLIVDHPSGVHNGGDIHFSPTDGYLYISVGDGAFDSFSSQDNNSLLGKILRIDVDGDDFPADSNRNYAIPADNPYVSTGAGEIWLSGFRNPFRFSFDRLNGDIFVGDVGEDTWEEFNYLPAASGGGMNFGWPCFEGDDQMLTNGCGPSSEYTFPIVSLEHGVPDTNFCSAIGGHRYRGNAFPNLSGWYIFTDWCDGRFFAARESNGQWQHFDMGVLVGGFAVTGFGENDDGELFIVAWDTVMQVVGAEDLIFASDFE